MNKISKISAEAFAQKNSCKNKTNGVKISLLGKQKKSRETGTAGDLCNSNMSEPLDKRPAGGYRSARQEKDDVFFDREETVEGGRVFRVNSRFWYNCDITKSHLKIFLSWKKGKTSETNKFIQKVSPNFVENDFMQISFIEKSTE